MTFSYIDHIAQRPFHKGRVKPINAMGNAITVTNLLDHVNAVNGGDLDIFAIVKGGRCSSGGGGSGGGGGIHGRELEEMERSTQRRVHILYIEDGKEKREAELTKS